MKDVDSSITDNINRTIDIRLPGVANTPGIYTDKTSGIKFNLLENNILQIPINKLLNVVDVYSENTVLEYRLEDIILLNDDSETVSFPIVIESKYESGILSFLGWSHNNTSTIDNELIMIYEFKADSNFYINSPNYIITITNIIEGNSSSTKAIPSYEANYMITSTYKNIPENIQMDESESHTIKMINFVNGSTHDVTSFGFNSISSYGVISNIEYQVTDSKPYAVDRIELVEPNPFKITPRDYHRTIKVYWKPKSN